MLHLTPSNQPSYAALPRDLRDDATCTTHHHSFASFEAKLENPSPSCFPMKQAAGYQCVSSHHLHSLISFEAQTDKPPPLGFEAQTKKPSQWFWGPNYQTVDLGFEAQIKKPLQWFWSQTTDKPSPLVLRLNWKTHAPHLLYVYDADCTWLHSTFWSSDHWVSDLCLIIPNPLHQVSYSWLDPHCFLLCRFRHLYFTRQATVLLETK
jgi:hypothetical protein